MTEINRINEMLCCSFYKDAWHGPAFLEVLKDITAKQAAKKPIAKAHSIWELVLHSTTWIKAVDKIVTEMEYIPVTAADNWPKIGDKSAKSWDMALNSLKKSHKKLEKHVLALNPATLKKKAANTNSTIARLLYGIVQHNIYHAGQIAILKKSK